MRRLVFWLLGLPAAILIVALSVANRAPVRFSLDPLSVADPAVSVTLPLFLLLFGAGFVGLLVGWTAGWAGQSRWRREARERRRELESLKARGQGPAPAGQGSETGRALTRAA